MQRTMKPFVTCVLAVLIVLTALSCCITEQGETSSTQNQAGHKVTINAVYYTMYLRDTFGDDNRDYFANQNGANITNSGVTGTYLFRFNDSTKAYSYTLQ